MGSHNWVRSIRKTRWEMRLAVVATLAVGILLGTLITNGVRAARDNPTPASQPLTLPPATAPAPTELSATFREVAQKVEPAVVNIHTESIVTTQRRQPRFRPEIPDPFDDFFERFFGFGAPERFRERSLGSGVIVDPDGYILTNYHVIRGADKIDVRLASDTKDYRAKVIGHDQETDMAVIKIDAGRKLPVAKLGNSDGAQVGDWVLAIGSPFGLDATVTAGIVSYKGRQGQQFQRFIQTDAAINRGNSGGPLVNLAGEVIGINTAIMSSRGVYAGVGFALPSNTAIGVYNQIVQQGRVVRGSIGVTFRSATSENEAILRSFGASHGVLIEEVRRGSPADKAGLQRGDVITQVDDTPIYAGDDLVNKVAATPVGGKVAIHYVRDKKEGTTTAVVEDRTKVFADMFEAAGREPHEEASASLGMNLEELTPGLARRYGLEEGEGGLLVREVELGSFADQMGVLRGDVMLEFNRQRVRTLEDFRAVQRQLQPGSDVVFWLKRRFPNGWSGFYVGDRLPE